MPRPQSTSTRQLAATKKATLSDLEVGLLTEKLAALLECDSDSIALLTLLINHLEQVREESHAFCLATSAIKNRLFAVTTDSEDAQRRFEMKAKAQRGTLLEFRNEKRA